MSFCQSCADALHKNALGPRTVDSGTLQHGISEVNCWLGAGGSDSSEYERYICRVLKRAGCSTGGGKLGNTRDSNGRLGNLREH